MRRVRRRRRRPRGFVSSLLHRLRGGQRTPSSSRGRAASKRVLPAILTVAVVTGLWCLLFLPLHRSYELLGEPGGRISTLDYLLARQSAGDAAESQRGGDWEAAMHHARNGLSRNPASRIANRVLLQGLSRPVASRPEADLAELRTTSRRLLKLAPHDPDDLRLALRAAMIASDFELIITNLLPQARTIPPDLQELLLDALLRTGRWREETQLVQALVEPPDVPPALQLFRLALNVLSTSGTASARAWEELRQAGTEPESSVLAARLLLDVAEQRQDLPAARAALFRLSRQSDDLLRDHLLLWNVLLAEGLHDEVKLLIRNRARQPRTPDELVACLELMEAVNLLPEAQNLAEEAYYSGLDDGRGFLTCLLMFHRAGKASGANRTSEFRLLHSDLRVGGFDKDTTRILEHLTQGLLADADGRTQQAQQAYDRLVTASQNRPDQVVRVAQFLVAADQPHRAGALLTRTEAALQSDRTYWQLRQQVAVATRNTTDLMFASQRAVELAPTDRLALAHLSLSQILDRRENTEGFEILARDLSLHPDATKRSVYLALGYAWFGHNELALAKLDQTPLESLDPADRELARFARCEALFKLGDLEESKSLARLLDPDQLFVAQRRWLSTVGLIEAAADASGAVNTANPAGWVVRP